MGKKLIPETKLTTQLTIAITISLAKSTVLGTFVEKKSGISQMNHFY